MVNVEKTSSSILKKFSHSELKDYEKRIVALRCFVLVENNCLVRKYSD